MKTHGVAPNTSVRSKLTRAGFGLALAVTGWSLPFSSAGAATPTCLGFAATVVGTTGTNGDDVIIGSQVADVIDGKAGNDIICGNAGDDVIRGGDGNDIIRAGDGDDQIRAGKGDDQIRAGTGNDDVRGESGNDESRGEAGSDQVVDDQDPGSSDLVKGDNEDDTDPGDLCRLNVTDSFTASCNVIVVV